MTKDLRLRRETQSDADLVAQVVGAAFGPASPTVPDLVHALRPYSHFGDGPAIDAPLALVAELDRELVGHVMLTLAHVDTWESLAPVLVLSPLAVRPDRQGRGIGTALVAGALELAGSTNAPALFLEGSPKYYRARGFAAAEPLGFRRPSLRIPRPAFQVALLPGYSESITGTLIYPPPFWQLDCVGLRDRALVQRIEAAG